MKKHLLAVCAFGLCCPFASADTLIHAGTLIDGAADRASSEMTIRVSGNTITDIESGYAAPGAGDTVIDLRAHTVLPGLMDMHVHLTGEYNPNSRLSGFVLNEADLALDAAKFAKRTLEAGFTVVRNLGDSFNVTVALRNAIAAGDVPGPTIFTAARGLSSTGGHGDATNGWAAHLISEPTIQNNIVNSVEDARKAVRQRYKDGAGLDQDNGHGGRTQCRQERSKPAVHG